MQNDSLNSFVAYSNYFLKTFVFNLIFENMKFNNFLYATKLLNTYIVIISYKTHIFGKVPL